MQTAPSESLKPTENKRSGLARVRRISIRSLLAVTALCAALLGVWRAFIYEPPTHKILSYEKAPSTQKLTIRVGPNTIAIKSVARNRPDGFLAIETGAGAQLSKQVPGSEVLTACSKWMDVAQIELHPGVDRFEVIEARIFDHATRLLLSELDPAFGWQVVGDNLLQVYGLGKELPPSLDVWLRVHSYDAKDEAFRLAPLSGSTASIPGGTISLAAVQDGFAGWNSATGFAPVKDEGDARSAMVLTWTGTPHKQHYQIAATSVHGDKQFYDRYLNVGATGEGKELITFDFPLNEIDHLELRPHGGRHRFFFEAVQLPKSAVGRSFDPPPSVHLPVNQEDVQTVIAEFAPLRVRIAVNKGANVAGISSNGFQSLLHLREPIDIDQALTITYHVQGITSFPLAFDFVDSNSGIAIDEAPFRSKLSAASGPTHRASAETFSIPMRRVEAIEISMKKSP